MTLNLVEKERMEEVIAFEYTGTGLCQHGGMGKRSEGQTSYMFIGQTYEVKCEYWGKEGYKNQHYPSSCHALEARMWNVAQQSRTCAVKMSCMCMWCVKMRYRK